MHITTETLALPINSRFPANVSKVAEESAAKLSTMLPFVCFKRRRRYAVHPEHLKLLTEESQLSPAAPHSKRMDCRESMSHSRCVSLVQRKILTKGRFGREGLRLKPDSYSGSNTDGLTV